MTIKQIRKRWEQLKHMQPSHPEEDPIDCETTALNFAAEHFDTLLAEIERLRLRIRNFECLHHRRGCPNGYWINPHTCIWGFQGGQESAPEGAHMIDSPGLTARDDELEDNDDRRLPQK